MIVPIRDDWTPDSVTLIQHTLELDNIVVPLAPTTKGLVDKLAIVDNAVARDHPVFRHLGKHPGFILFTSGTTGAPKAALHDFTRFYSKFTRRPGKPYRTLMFLLFDHIGGWNTLFYTLAAGGVPIYLQDRSPGTVCAAIESERVELLPTTPTFLNMLLYTEAYKQHDLSSLKVVTYGTEPMPQATLEACRRILPQVTFKQTYGLSELGILGTKSESSDSIWLRVGGEGFEIDVRENILWIRSETSMVGYLNAPSPFDSQGWYCTGDIVERRGEYIRFLGRESEIINVGGTKVAPIEVESAILEVPGVRDVEVHGEKNEIMGNVVVASVVAAVPDTDGLTHGIIRYCRDKLGRYAAPVRVDIVEEIGITERGKKKR
jgi:long-chain acyl-CoA synthetase